MTKVEFDFYMALSCERTILIHSVHGAYKVSDNIMQSDITAYNKFYLELIKFSYLLKLWCIVSATPMRNFM